MFSHSHKLIVIFFISSHWTSEALTITACQQWHHYRHQQWKWLLHIFLTVVFKCDKTTRVRKAFIQERFHCGELDVTYIQITSHSSFTQMLQLLRYKKVNKVTRNELITHHHEFTHQKCIIQWKKLHLLESNKNKFASTNMCTKKIIKKKCFGIQYHSRHRAAEA